MTKGLLEVDSLLKIIHHPLWEYFFTYFGGVATGILIMVVWLRMGFMGLKLGDE